jgi:hypothetical protein
MSGRATRGPTLGQARPMVLASLAALVACRAAPDLPDPPRSHPAHPAAAQAPLPPRSDTLAIEPVPAKLPPPGTRGDAR